MSNTPHYDAMLVRQQMKVQRSPKDLVIIGIVLVVLSVIGIII